MHVLDLGAVSVLDFLLRGAEAEVIVRGHSFMFEAMVADVFSEVLRGERCCMVTAKQFEIHYFRALLPPEPHHTLAK